MSALPEEEFFRKLHPRHFNWNRQPAVWLLALLIGIAAGYATISLRLLIDLFTLISFQATEATLLDAATQLDWPMRLTIPTIGGLGVGIALYFLLPRGRTEGVADVIESRALHGGTIPLKTGLASATIATLSLGVGASSGREGPAIHLGGTLASIIARRFQHPPRIARILLGAGVAAAVSASFNAPLAGVLFALEVILGHYAPRAFAPIVIASVAGSVVCRLHIGDMPAFIIPHYTIESFWEGPAFAMLGVVSAIVAVAFIRSVQFTDRWARQIAIPLWARPAIGGFLIGLIALAFPHVLGVGYGATDDALKGQYSLILLLSLVVAKIAATTITMASRFGGGVFSPSLFIGAMTGGAFGILAGQIFPDIASQSGLYAIIGMAAVSAAILGAPISTTLIVFELTGDYAVMIALMIASSISTLLTQAMIGKSFFHMQLDARGLHASDGPQRLLLETIRVEEIMTADSSGLGQTIEDETPTLFPDETLERALDILDKSDLETVLVVDRKTPTQPIGYVYHKRALQIFNRALVEANIEEHR